MKFNENGYLEPGFHDLGILDIEKYFVDGFEDSLTRRNIIKGYKQFIEELSSFGIKELECWIDGSFSTDKRNPNDIDIVLIINKDILDNIPIDKQKDLNQLFVDARINYDCDAYLVISVDSMHQHYSDYVYSRSYWRGFFTFDRKEVPKGIIRLNIEKEVD